MKKVEQIRQALEAKVHEGLFPESKLKLEESELDEFEKYFDVQPARGGYYYVYPRWLFEEEPTREVFEDPQRLLVWLDQNFGFGLASYSPELARDLYRALLFLFSLGGKELQSFQAVVNAWATEGSPALASRLLEYFSEVVGE